MRRQTGRKHAAAEDCEVEGQQGERDGGEDDLYGQDGPGHTIVQGCDPYRLHIDHVVEGLDVKARRARDRCLRERLRREPPELALQLRPIGNRLTRRGAAWHRARETNTGIGVTHQASKRPRSDRFCQGLGTEIGRADRIRVLDDGVTPRLVTSDSQGKAEGQDEPDQPE